MFCKTKMYHDKEKNTKKRNIPSILFDIILAKVIYFEFLKVYLKVCHKWHHNQFFLLGYTSGDIGVKIEMILFDYYQLQ